MFDLSRAIETLSALVGKAAEVAPQSSDVLGGVLAKAGFDPVLAESFQARAAQLLADRGIDPAALSSDQLGALMSQHGLEKPP